MPEMTVAELLEIAIETCDDLKYKFEFTGLRRGILMKNYQSGFKAACANSGNRMFSRIDAYIRNKDDGLQEQLEEEYWKSVDASCELLEKVYYDVIMADKAFKVQQVEYAKGVNILTNLKKKFEENGNILNVRLEAICQYHIDTYGTMIDATSGISTEDDEEGEAVEEIEDEV